MALFQDCKKVFFCSLLYMESLTCINHKMLNCYMFLQNNGLLHCVMTIFIKIRDTFITFQRVYTSFDRIWLVLEDYKCCRWFRIVSGGLLIKYLKIVPTISVFSFNTGKYGPEKPPYLDTFHAVSSVLRLSSCSKILPGRCKIKLFIPAFALIFIWNSFYSKSLWW